MLKLPSLQRLVQIVDAEGKPSLWFHQWWQKVADQVTSAFNTAETAYTDSGLSSSRSAEALAATERLKSALDQLATKPPEVLNRVAAALELACTSPAHEPVSLITVSDVTPSASFFPMNNLTDVRFTEIVDKSVLVYADKRWKNEDYLGIDSGGTGNFEYDTPNALLKYAEDPDPRFTVSSITDDGTLVTVDAAMEVTGDLTVGGALDFGGGSFDVTGDITATGTVEAPFGSFTTSVNSPTVVTSFVDNTPGSALDLGVGGSVYVTIQAGSISIPTGVGVRTIEFDLADTAGTGYRALRILN